MNDSTTKTTADQRVIQAREYLTGARRRKVSELPQSVVAREDAELRRLLGQVLDYVTESVSLSDDQLVTLGQALGDAVAWHTDTEPCGSCEYAAPTLCAEHAEAVRLRDAYIRLSRELGIEVRS
jgi:hypothetical protein